MKYSKWIISFAFLVSGVTVMAAPNLGYDRIAGHHHASRSEVIAPHGMAATSQPLATQIALDILKAGGSAVDAAIAANAALGLMEVMALVAIYLPSSGTPRKRSLLG